MEKLTSAKEAYEWYKEARPKNPEREPVEKLDQVLRLCRRSFELLEQAQKDREAIDAMKDLGYENDLLMDVGMSMQEIQTALGSVAADKLFYEQIMEDYGAAKSWEDLSDVLRPIGKAKPAEMWETFENGYAVPGNRRQPTFDEERNVDRRKDEWPSPPYAKERKKDLSVVVPWASPSRRKDDREFCCFHAPLDADIFQKGKTSRWQPVPGDFVTGRSKKYFPLYRAFLEMEKTGVVEFYVQFDGPGSRKVHGFRSNNCLPPAKWEEVAKEICRRVQEENPILRGLAFLRFSDGSTQKLAASL